MQLSNGFLYALVNKLFGRQPAHAALADVADRKDVFAQWSLGFIEAGEPEDVPAPHVHEIEDECDGSRALYTQRVADSLRKTQDPAGDQGVRVDPLSDLLEP